MGVYIGCDIGTVSVKAVALSESTPALKAVPDKGTLKPLERRSPFLNRSTVLLSDYKRISGNPLHAALRLLRDVTFLFPETEIK